MSSGLKEKLKQKLKAGFIHLLLSLLIFIVVLYFILYEWYPEPFFSAQGGWQGIKLMAFVDIVLGPMLTLIVYNHLKSRKLIVLDLSIIAVIQIVALLLGGYTVYTQRPIALVYWGTAFYTVTEEDYHAQGIAKPDFSQFSSHIPPLIYSRPVSTREELEYSDKLTQKSVPAYAHVDFYEDIKDHLDAIFYNEIDIKGLVLTNPVMLKRLEDVTGKDLEAYKYVRLKAKYNNMILVMSESGGLVGWVTVASD